MSQENKKKSHLGIFVTLCVLMISVFCLAYLNAGDIDYKKELEMNAVFELKQDNRVIQVTMDEMLNLNPVIIDVVMDTSTSDPTDVEFTGVELKTILEYVGFKLDEVTKLEVRSLDGYSSAITLEEVMMNDNVYICIAQNGKSLQPKEEGGMGPYLMVIKNANFSQRWCKFVQEVILS